MQGTRIEIFKGGEWLRLVLSDNEVIKYNKVINRIGRVDSREISHTNTFELAPVWKNTNYLGLNIFNPKQLAQALNTKYIARYYVEDKLLQKGFLVINNTNDGTIKVNFIDEALEITEIWGTTTYRDMLKDSTLLFPVDYQAAIDEIVSYDMDRNSVLTPTSEVGTRGYNLCLFPNSLNAIGEKFQINALEQRLDDVFNPYQSRPVFNAVSLFELATTAYGYDPILDDSVDWEKVSKTFMVDKDLLASAKGNNGIQTIQHPRVPNAGTPFYIRTPGFTDPNGFTYMAHLYDFPSSVSRTPASIPNFVEPLWFNTYTGPPTNSPPSQPWLHQNVIFEPDTDSGNVGTIRLQCDVYMSGGSAPGPYQTVLVGIWKNSTSGGDTIDSVLDSWSAFNPSTGPHVTLGTDTDFDVTIDKAIFDTIPSGASELIGMAVRIDSGPTQNAVFNLGNLIVTEQYLPVGVIAYDDYGQYLPDTVDLRHAAPNETIKSLLSGIMHKEGILMNIDNLNREIKFFTYGAYEKQKFEGNFSDWSNYLRRYNPLKHNTDFGTDYAKKNRIGLNSPYQGNTFDFFLENQGDDSKYKDFTTNYLSKFKDIQNVREIFNTNTPYLEFENKGLGLVEYTGTIAGTLSQQRADDSVQGDFTDLFHLQNVNGSVLPDGVKEWYKLIDEAIKADAQYLIPTDVIKTLDLSEPIYVEELGGFYIIEEIEAYVNSSKMVTVKVIKLIDDLRGLGSGPDVIPAEPIITLSSFGLSPNGSTTFNYSIVNNTTFTNYIPTSATIKGVQWDGIPNVGGSAPTGFEFNQAVTVPPYTATQNVFNGDVPLGAQEGWYLIQVTDGDDPLLVSNEQLVYLGDNSPPPDPVANIFVPNENPPVANGLADILWSYNYFTAAPTYVTLEWRKHDFSTGNPIGPLRTLSLPTTGVPSGGATIVQHDFVDGAGFYKIQLRTNVVDSSGVALAGEFWSIL